MFGLQTAMGRIGAIMGTVLFGELQGISRYLPILIVATLLMGRGLGVFLLPNAGGKGRLS